jgi:hypothetical protein
LQILLILLILSALAIASDKKSGLNLIISKNIEARGGINIIKQLTSLKVIGMQRTSSGEAPFTAYYKPPKYMLMASSKMVQGRDDDGAWIMMKDDSPKRTIQIYNHIFSFQADIEGPFIDYEQKGYHLELVNEKTIEDETVYVVKVLSADKGLWHILIDKVSYLEKRRCYFLQESGESQSPLLEIIYDDYKVVNEVKFPHKIENYIQGKWQATTIVEKIEIGEDIENSQFSIGNYEQIISEKTANTPLHHLQSIDNLKEIFDADFGKVRLFLLLSSTCSSCKEGYLALQNILSREQSNQLSIYIIWLPILPGDNLNSAIVQSSELADKRAVQLWDNRLITGNLWKSILDYPQEITFDVYLLYDKNSRWFNGIGIPNFWMHQSSGISNVPKFDKNTLEEKIKKFLSD